LVVINAVLLVALFARQPTVAVQLAGPRPESSPVVMEPAASPSARPSPTPSSSERPARQPSDIPAPPPPASRLLAVASDRLGWRATRGGCEDEATVEVTTDGARTWRQTQPGVSALGRLKSYDQRSVFAIGAAAQCRPTYAWQPSAAGGWQRDTGRMSDIWFRLPAEPDWVHAPGGRRSSPCSTGLADLAGLGTYRAAALCRDGRIRTTDNGGRWTTVLKASGGRALNADDTEFVVARTVPSCAGIAVQRFDVAGRGLDDSSGRCLRSARRSAPVAVAIGPSTTWLWSGDDVTVF